MSINNLIRLTTEKTPKFGMGIRRWSLDSPHKGSIMRCFDAYFAINLSTNCCINSRFVGCLRRHWTRVWWGELMFCHINNATFALIIMTSLFSALGLNDSPIGLAGYILEKFSTATNINYRQLRDGGLTKKFTLDDLLTDVSIYWFTGTIGSSVRLYKELWKDEEFSKLDRWALTSISTAKCAHDFWFALFCSRYCFYLALIYRCGQFTPMPYKHMVIRRCLHLFFSVVLLAIGQSYDCPVPVK